MDIQISLEKASFPSKGTTLIHFISEDTLTDNPYLTKLGTTTATKVQKKIKQMGFTGKKNQILSVEIGTPYESVVLVGTGKSTDCTAAVIKDATAEAIRNLQPQKVTKATLFYQKNMSISHFDFGNAIALGVFSGNYVFTKYKSQEKLEASATVSEIMILAEDLSNKQEEEMITGITRGTLIGEGLNMTRDLVNEPASHVYPETLSRIAKAIAEKSKGKVSVTIMGREECERMGMGAFLGVAQGSDKEPQFIVLKYNPEKAKAEQLEKKICFIGKSITFDSGGYSIKPAEFMEDMKIDMAGGAAVLGTFSILAEWDEEKFGNIPYEVYGILAACENMISGNAFRPGDIVTAMNGKTIEVLNTDAEGRLTLADALSYADRELKADMVIDFATLTGAAMVALGSDIGALFGNESSFTQAFKKAADKEHEPVWEMPLYQPYTEDIVSDVGDLRNITRYRWGGAVTAALFLQEFVDKMKWVHVDIAGPSYNTGKPKGVYPKGATGWGVQTVIEVLTTKDL